MEDRFQWKPSTDSMVDWEAFGDKFTTVPLTTCPKCKQCTEIFGHMQTCKKNSSQWADIHEVLTYIYKKHNINPVICILLNAYIVLPTKGKATSLFVLLGLLFLSWTYQAPGT
eukprot:12159328-Ditylum_brightwellii.AAC.1